jgi:hypothetical protein
MNWKRLQTYCFKVPKGKRTQKQKKALESRREAFKRACNSAERDRKPFDKTPIISPPIDSQTTNKPKSI